MATAAYISTGQFPLMGQPAATYELDPIAQQAYQASVAGYVPTAAHPQQQVFLTSGQPVQVVAGHGGAMFPQMRFQNPAPNVYMPHPPSNIINLPYTGDIHAPPAYSEMDSPRFPNSRSRRSSFSMSFAAGQYGYPASQMGQMSQIGQMGGPMDYSYVENCMLCRANHPGPHPHGPNMGMNDLPPMSTHRHMSMDDSMSTSSKMRGGGSAYSYEGPMCDPMDWNPGVRGRDRRDPSWDYRSRPHVRSRSKSQGPNRSGRQLFNGVQVSEISDDESEDDTASRGGRVTNYSNSARRASSQRAQRPSSRVRPVNPTSSSSYL